MYKIVISLLVSLPLIAASSETYHGPHCESLTYSSCTSMEYNSSFFPNILGHESQRDAVLDLKTYTPLMKLNCSSFVRKLLCILFLPPCVKGHMKPLPPCRRLCMHVKIPCGHVMRQFDISWPRRWDCNRFPDEGLCISDDLTNKLPLPTLPTTLRKKNGTTLSSKFQQMECPRPFHHYGFKIHAGRYSVNDCGMPCSGVYFESSERTFARYWIGLWSIVCFLATLFTVLTFLIEPNRFLYPERCIILLAACYMIVSLTYVIGFFMGDDFPAACIDSHSKQRLIAQGTKHEGCTTIFMILYFFSQSSSVWWVMLTLTWFLSSALKWGHEAIDAKSQYFHLVAWALPAIQTIAVLISGAIDGDVLSGVCSAGLYNPRALLAFQISPLLIYLLIGLVLLFICFVSLFKIRRTMLIEGAISTDKLECFMARVGIFSVLYSISVGVVIACSFYEFINYEYWINFWHQENCKPRGIGYGPLVCLGSEQIAKKPDFSVFLMKYLMFLMVGISAGFWVWTGKTITSWRNFIAKHFRPPLKAQGGARVR